MTWLIEKFQRAFKNGKGRCMTAIWHIGTDGRLHLDVNRHSFPRADLENAIELLLTNLRENP